MNSPPEPVSPSPSTPSSGSPPPDELFADHITSSISPLAPHGSQQPPSPSQTKRRLAPASSTHGRDLKARKRDDGGGRKVFAQGAESGGRESGRKEELVDVDLMERLKQEFGDPFDESVQDSFSP